jgi:hypothetical protein
MEPLRSISNLNIARAFKNFEPHLSYKSIPASYNKRFLKYDRMLLHENKFSYYIQAPKEPSRIIIKS